MKRWSDVYSISLMSRVFEVSRSGYYDWFTRGPSARSREDERLKIEIRTAHQRNRETYGPRRLQPELAENGIQVGRDRITRLRVCTPVTTSPEAALTGPAAGKAPRVRR
jgi:transposase InsO family protein